MLYYIKMETLFLIANLLGMGSLFWKLAFYPFASAKVQAFFGVLLVLWIFSFYYKMNQRWKKP